MRVLYVSQTGMLEGLGQSQVLAYLRGLARRGIEIQLVSYEQANRSDDEIAAMRAAMQEAGIRWSPLRRAIDPRLRVKLREAARGVAHVVRLAREFRPDIVHGRSSLATAIADAVTRVTPGAHLLYDCRGMIGHEYVDSGYWTEDRIEYRLVTRYERRAFAKADGVVVLTNALRRWLVEQGYFGKHTATEVVPCCVDLDRFRVSEEKRLAMRRELGLGDDLTLVYAGSLGSFYREEDMARFARIVRKRAGERVRFLLLTPSDPTRLTKHLDDVVVRKVAPAAMPDHLSAGDVGLSFIISSFSKKGSSPTKVAEYLACGLAAVLNGDIGDQAELAGEPEAVAVVRSFSDGDLEEAADRALALARRPFTVRLAATRRVAEERFDLERVGVARYEALYRVLTSSSGTRRRTRS